MADRLYIAETPAAVKNAKGLHLITQNTPNGQAVQILLEELAAVYGLQWTTTLIHISTGEQKTEWFLRLNPNARIPVLIDNTQSPPLPVCETSAEMLYLLRSADSEGRFDFEDELEHSEALQWTFFWHGSGGVYQQLAWFFAYAAPEKVPSTITYFKNESLHAYGALETRLSGRFTGEPRDYLAGKGRGKYSVADIKTWPWVKGWMNCGFSKEDMASFPHLLRWVDRIARRPAVQTGIGKKYM